MLQVRSLNEYAITIRWSIGDADYHARPPHLGGDESAHDNARYDALLRAPRRSRHHGSDGCHRVESESMR